MSSTFHLAQYFPNLGESYAITSPQDEQYNCIAWAAGDSSRWWWPDDDSYWPQTVERVHSLAAFVAAFMTLGYEACLDQSHQVGYEKIAIYGDD